MTPNQRIQSIAGFVQAHLNKMAEIYPDERHNPVYRWEHTQRVAHYGKLIADQEGADAEIVTAACLLHDVAHFECEDDYKNHGTITGDRLFKQQLDRQFDFFESLIEEYRLTTLPILTD